MAVAVEGVVTVEGVVASAKADDRSIVPLVEVTPG
jgi:hypothetical protein